MSNYLSDEYLLEAMKFLYAGEIIEAKKKLEYIIETEPGYGRAHYLLGCIYWRLFNDYQSAKNHFSLAIKFSPEYPKTYLTYVYLLNEINNAEALQRLAIKALQVPGVDKASIHYELGESFEKIGNFKKALHHYQLSLMLTVCSDFSKFIESSIERTETKIKRFSLKSLYKYEVLC